MTLIASSIVAEKCDYSFGDYAGVRHRLFNAGMKDVNMNNSEFLSFCELCRQEGKNIMTLFVDNVRLYKRTIFPDIATDKKLFEDVMEKHDLLKLCSQIPWMNFIIFTGHEDLEIDSTIHNLIPPNVVKILAINAISYGGKVEPFYYGLQRKLHPEDYRLEQLKIALNSVTKANKMLYVNHSVTSAPKHRSGIYELFNDKEWATCKSRIAYEPYLEDIKEHRFMICPIGNAIDCHKNYEVLYMKRVPVMKKHPYLQYLFRKFPVLWVDEWTDVTLELLESNMDLYYQVLNMDMGLLELDYIFRDVDKNITIQQCIENVYPECYKGGIEEYLQRYSDRYQHWLIDNAPDGTAIKILPYLQDIKKGFFVEAGAEDGRYGSITYLLEKMGWKGLLVEPAAIHIQTCKDSRPHSIVEHYALVSPEFKDSTIDTSVLNLMKDTVTKECPAITFDKLADKHSVTHIDFFCLDTEGYEMEILKGINFDSIGITWFLIECNTDRYSYESLLQLMQSTGYELVANISNFTKENTPTWPGTHQEYLFKKKTNK